MNIGTRVKVGIIKPKTYARGAYESLNGKTGVAEEIRGEGHYNHGLVLVRFDVPATAWLSYQLPVEAFHFNMNELIDISESPVLPEGQKHNHQHSLNRCLDDDDKCCYEWQPLKD